MGAVMYDFTSTTPNSETEYNWLRSSPRGKEEGEKTEIGQL